MKRKRAEALLQGRKHIKLEIKLLKSIKSENTSPPCSKNFREEQSDCFSVGIDLTESKRMENSKTFEKTSEQDLKNEDEELSEYEKRRLINIKRNQAMLISLGVTTAASFLSAKERRVPRKPKAKPFQPIRRSTRISGNANGRTVSQIVPNTPANSVAVTEKRQSGPVNAVPENDVEEADSKNFLHSLDMLNKNTKITTNIVSEEMSCTESFKERTSKLRVSVENVCKIVWEKITTMTFHPSCDKTIICAGDRKGNIGFWNVDATSTNSKIFIYRPHIYPVRAMCFHPTRNDLMSCGADGTFKRADFNTCVFDEIYASNDRGINSFSYPYNSRETFLLAFTDGHMTVLDTRESKSKNTSHLCHTKAIKCIDCHPANEYLFCTSSADATVAIWDLRRIKGMKSKLGTFQGHNRSVTSAYFSPLDGKYVLSTSWDDTVKVLEQTSSSKLEVKRNFRHFNQTNRWLSAFKATWDPRNGRGFVIGSMLANRRIQFYHVEQRTKAPLLEMFNENFTTIASTNVFHPSKNIIASGNSSGKVFVWSE